MGGKGLQIMPKMIKNCYLYQSDLADFDFIILTHTESEDDLTDIISDVIGDWIQDVDGAAFEVLQEYIVDRLKEKNINVSIYEYSI